MLLTSFVGIWHIASGSAQEQNKPSKWKVKNTGPKDPRSEANPMTAAEASEYTIENQIPSRLPLKVELLNLDKEPLLANIEVKITNTSKKPIYFLEIVISLPDFKLPQGAPLGYILRYGRSGLMAFKEPITPDDRPINPNESHIFKINEDMRSMFEQQIAEINRAQSEIRRVYLFFGQLNFVDITGFYTLGGLPFPPPNYLKKSLNAATTLQFLKMLAKPRKTSAALAHLVQNSCQAGGGVAVSAC
jgi:hypothetical protein